MKCFYHSADLDGHCSGAIVKMRYPDCEMIGINYGDDFPWESIEQGEHIIMVDFSLQPFERMIRLDNICSLEWLDHHKSAIESAEDSGVWKLDPKKLRSGIGACFLVWEHYYSGKATPRAVILLAEYDVWEHSDPDTLPFQFGLRQYETLPDEQHLWRQLFEVDGVNPLDDIIKEGATILNYKASEDRKYASTCAFDAELDGLKCVAINKMLTNSQLFDSVWDSKKYDAMLTFGYRKGSWTVSLYSYRDDIDVSMIAKNRGGGGHKGAAGFQCDELPFKL